MSVSVSEVSKSEVHLFHLEMGEARYTTTTLTHTKKNHSWHVDYQMGRSRFSLYKLGSTLLNVCIKNSIHFKCFNWSIEMERKKNYDFISIFVLFSNGIAL